MPIQNANVSATQAAQSGAGKSPTGNGIVYSVILDEKHPYLKNREDVEGKESNFIGAILFRLVGQPSPSEESLPIAYPFDKNQKNLPVRNESVEIIQGISGQSLYRRIGIEVSPNVDADEKQITKMFPPNQLDSSKKQEYSKVQSTGIARSNNDESAKNDGYGDYFKKEAGIHKLKLYEGDMLFESRFGQSIRFSGYNNTENKFSPTIIIRNNESADSKKAVIKYGTLEDINKDGSIISLSSEQHQLAFLPGTVDDKNKSDFETKPQSFKSYPSKLIGDQILINSGRIILSAKNAEMIFYSKKNYGFISDGGLSIDNKLGIEVNVGDNTNVKTNDRDINLNTGNGKINLGDKELEPILKGDKWVSLMEELIDAILKQNYLTPSGPSKIAPENAPTFNSIKKKLKTVLSELNKTA